MSKIGLLLIATNKYSVFLQPLISSSDTHFLSNHDVTYFVFTNHDMEISSNRNVVQFYVEHRPWPWMTLGRYKIFSQQKKILSQMDYLYYCDVDMLMVGEVGDEILSDRVATQHPGFYGSRGSPETEPTSSACVYAHEPMQYFAGGFNGGTSSEYLKMSQTIMNNIDSDLDKGYIAVWHDESHMNRYFIDHPPTKILCPSYCYHIPYGLPFPSKIITLDKNHEEIRQ